MKKFKHINKKNIYFMSKNGILYNDNSLHALKKFKSNSINCCVTSPPYWGLRDYKNDDQLGQESLPEYYIKNLTTIFNEVYRVLKKDGVLFLNIGDTYANIGRKSQSASKMRNRGANKENPYGNLSKDSRLSVKNSKLKLKNKDLCMLPFHVAFSLQQNGWYLRQIIPWIKRSGMPESVKDRPGLSHEYILQFSKNEKYFFDYTALLKAYAIDLQRWGGIKYKPISITNDDTPSNRKRANRIRKMRPSEEGRIGRTSDFFFDSLRLILEGKELYLTHDEKFIAAFINTNNRKIGSGIHYASFPQKLIKPLILAGCPKNGIVLDPFNGSGTTSIVSERHNRKWIGIELNEDYCAFSEELLGEVLLNKKIKLFS